MTKFLPILIILFFTGCATYKFAEVENDLNQRNFVNAYNYLKKNAPKNPDFQYLSELGLTAHYANKYSESSKAFDQAEQIAEERYTKSLTTEAGALITSDRLRPYVSSRYERLLGHYYHALNYIKENNIDDALVECRRVSNLIKYFAREEKNYDYFGTGFLAHFSGILFEASGELNDALISYKQAENYYKNASDTTGVQVPNDVGRSLVRLTQKLNFTDEYKRYRTVYGESSPVPENYGELIVFYETGYVPRKEEQSLTFPILKTDKFVEGKEKNHFEYARTLRKREGLVVEEIKLEYLLRIAIPTIYSKRPQFKGITVSVGDEKEDGELVEDVEMMAIETFNTERPIILLRTLARGLLKYLAVRKVKKGNEVLGLLTNLAGVITESADTRAWQTLPNQIYMVRMPLPAGQHKISLSFLNGNGNVRQNRSLPNTIKISSNRTKILNFRTFK